MPVIIIIPNAALFALALAPYALLTYRYWRRHRDARPTLNSYGLRTWKVK